MIVCACCGFAYEPYFGEDGCGTCYANPETCSPRCATALAFWRGVASKRLDELEIEIDAHLDRYMHVDQYLPRWNLMAFVSSEFNFWRCVTLAEKLRAAVGREVWLGVTGAAS